VTERDEEGPESVAAATVVVIRDGTDGLETLLLRRNSALGFAGGAWVFPGGRVDPGDADPDHPDDEAAAARRAAVREALEEANLVVDPERLVVLSHWTPPLVAARRFATWFFLAEAPATPVQVDGGEIVEHLWVRPTEGLERHAAGQVELLPPTWVTLHRLARHPNVAEALAGIAAEPVDHYLTKFAVLDGRSLALWAGDAGYETGDASASGRRHRLDIGELPWRYERD
jgi:8-oxo-dGTP pyrophosphatase MutT (NUDIX family)